jgi:outer membrane protein TolC
LLPQVSLQAGVELNGGAFADRASAWIVGTQVAWNVFSGGASQARLREATSTVARARAERDRLEAAVRVEVRSAVARVDAARARADVGRAAVEQARESQRIIRDRYEAGLSPASELLRANQALLDADALRTGAVVDLLVSRAALDRAVGKQE